MTYILLDWLQIEYYKYASVSCRIDHIIFSWRLESELRLELGTV